VIIFPTGTEPVKEITRGISEEISAEPTSASPYTTESASLIAYSLSIKSFANL